jgi:hypothetical protein
MLYTINVLIILHIIHTSIEIHFFCFSDNFRDRNDCISKQGNPTNRQTCAKSRPLIDSFNRFKEFYNAARSCRVCSCDSTRLRCFSKPAISSRSCMRSVILISRIRARALALAENGQGHRTLVHSLAMEKHKKAVVFVQCFPIAWIPLGA